jgi:putative transposase
MACELPVRSPRRGRVTPPLTVSEATWVLSKLAYLTLCRSIQLLMLLARGEAAKDLEILMLRHQLTVLRRKVSRPWLEPADRSLLAAVSRVLPKSRWSCFFVKPETLLRWHRRLVTGAWTYPRHGQGRPPLDHDVQQLIIGLARENPRWGYQRIQGELQQLGVQVSATAIRTTLRRRHGLDPAPRRAPTTWRAFLRQQAAGIVACDLLHRRHDLATATVRAVLHRAGHPPGPPGRRDCQSRRQLDHAAGP